MDPISISAAARWLRAGGWKWLAGAITALLAAVTIGYLNLSLRAARSEAREKQATIDARDGEIALLRRARAADEASVQVRTIYVDRVVKEATERDTKTNEALKANPDWANEPVPTAVADSLR